jgi:hypothetical protein
MSTDRIQQPAAPSSEAAAQKLYDNTPAPAAKSPDRTPLPERAGEFYSWTQTAEVIKQRGPELYAQAGFDSAAQQALDQKYRRFGKETGLSDAVLASMAAGELDNLAAGARVADDPDADDFALAKQIADNNALLREEFTAQYGRREGEALLERTRRFVRKHPTLAQTLQARGLGSKPEIVRGIAHHVFITGWRG